ncbi:MAG: phosphate ABC transporter substrate-binding protein [Burkholderiales bacterium]|nr:phosphate ABC transporter substrate-binding protein [Burkholderiales bacterium]
MKLSRRQALVLAATSPLATAAQAMPQLDFWPFSRRAAREPLLIAGSGTMGELSAALAAAFVQRNPHVDIVVERGGSLSALIALKRGSVDVAAMSRDLRDVDDQKDVRNFLVARNAVGVVVHAKSPLRNLSSAQLRAIFDGTVRHWSAVGGPNLPLQVVTRKRGTPARQFVEEVALGGGEIAAGALEMDTPEQVIQTVQSDPSAIGFILLKDLRDASHLRLLDVDTIPASRETILSGRYPLTQSLYYVVMGGPNTLAQRFVAFACGPQGQAIVDAQHLVGTF